MIVGAFALAAGTSGVIEASITDSRSAPWTCLSASTTAPRRDYSSTIR